MNTLKDLTSAVAKKTGKSKKDVETIYNGLVEVITESANASEETKVGLPGIGTIVVKVKAEHIARNPSNNTVVTVPASRRAYIKLFPRFIQTLNEKK